MTQGTITNRRWQRHQVDLPVQVVLLNGASKVLVPGRLAEISAGGMALYAGVPLQPGDAMEVEFQTPYARVTGTIRSRTGYCFGIEFLTPLRIDDRAVRTSLQRFQQKHRAYLHEEEPEVSRLHRKLAVLWHAAQMLAVMKKH